MWTKSACVLLAWSILLTVTAAGLKESARPAQANTRNANSSERITLTSTLSADTPSMAAASLTSRTARYVVQTGDTLSGIAARFGLRGGWQALYAANRPAIGPNPNAIHTGITLTIPGQAAPVHPGPAAPARYTVAVGDTLSGIVARFGLRGGWQALYAANRPVIGPNPNAIHTGTVLTIPGSAPVRASAPPAAHPGHRPPQSPPPSGSQHRRPPVRTRAPAAAGMPTWLKVILLAAGILIGGAFLLELAMVIGRGRRKDAVRAAQVHTASAGQRPGSGSLVEDRTRIVLADYDRLVVTHSPADDTIYVLRSPDEEPKAILRVARLVLAEGPYRDLAEHLGLPASWPIILADYHRLVVTHCTADDTVYVLRPPGEDPKAILRAARLVLQEEPYEELASQLGVPANWPLE
jgi:LysM repeat protein